MASYMYYVAKVMQLPKDEIIDSIAVGGLFGNLIKVSGVVERLSQSAQNELANLVTLLLGITIGSTMSAEKFLVVEVGIVLGLGLVAFIFDTAGGKMPQRVDAASAADLATATGLRDGTDTGKRIPLVPTNKATAGLAFKPTADINLALFATHVGSRYFGGDTGNVDEKIAAYTTADFVATWRVANWTVRGRVANLTDKKYAALGFYGFGWGNSYYPADGRAFFADLRYDF